jgi:hypothetical protein
MGYSRTGIIFLLLGEVLIFMAYGCKKTGPIEHPKEKQVVYADSYHLFRFREPLNGQICYVLHSIFLSARLNAADFIVDHIVGMNRLVEEIEKMPKPCSLHARDFEGIGGIKGIIDDPNNIMCELTDTEIESLNAILKSRNIQQVTIY